MTGEVSFGTSFNRPRDPFVMDFEEDIHFRTVHRHVLAIFDPTLVHSNVEWPLQAPFLTSHTGPFGASVAVGVIDQDFAVEPRTHHFPEFDFIRQPIGRVAHNGVNALVSERAKLLSRATF